MYQAERKQILVTETPCPQFVETLKNGLAEAGFWAFQSFDLQSTRALHEGCACPHHGTEHCTCQMAVLLVYHSEGDPLTLVLDGRDNQTFVYLAEDAGKTTPPAIRNTITAVIEQTAVKMSIPVEPAASADS